MNIFAMITTKHSGHYTDHALKSFFDTTPIGQDDLFVLIDNDATYQLPNDPRFNRVNVLKNVSPQGYAQNVNIGIDLALAHKADLFLLNNDIILTPGWFEAMFIDDEAIYSPVSNREVQYKTGVFDSQMIMSLEEYLGKEAAFNQLVDVHRQCANGALRVLCLPFFCPRIPYKIVKTVGHFDEEYGRGGAEDYDYCLRVNLAGFSVKYANKAYIIHFGGKSSWSGVESRPEQEEREMKFKALFGYKWGMNLLKVCIFEDRDILAEGTALLEEIKKGNHKQVIEVLKGEHEIPIYL